MGKNEVTTSFQEVAITELQSGNEMVARKGAHFVDVKNIYLSGTKDQLGLEELTVEYDPFSSDHFYMLSSHAELNQKIDWNEIRAIMKKYAPDALL